jgi:hypothetical protein
MAASSASPAASVSSARHTPSTLLDWAISLVNVTTTANLRGSKMAPGQARQCTIRDRQALGNPRARGGGIGDAAGDVDLGVSVEIDLVAAAIVSSTADAASALAHVLPVVLASETALRRMISVAGLARALVAFGASCASQPVHRRFGGPDRSPA